ncbi:alpha/beta hydrolase [Candidatus Saccharibacteria bacterium]|nr:alpha/beta hydrolase [Candidatus Saccharibacteria bacterium]
MWQRFIHKWLKVPYLLRAVEYRSPKTVTATIIMLHGIGSSAKMWQAVASKLPDNTRVIAIDLLGFGLSPKPTWNTYNVKVQADSVATTLFSMKIIGPVVIVGHSLGSLVAIEFARRYPLMTKSLVLTSPPLYHPKKFKKSMKFKPDEILRKAHETMTSHPKDTERMLKLVAKYNLANKGFVVDNVNVTAFLRTLESAIINQSSYSDMQKITRPIHIVSGAFDLLVLDSTLKELASQMQNITWQRVAAAHEITGPMQSAVVSATKKAVHEATKSKSHYH